MTISFLDTQTVLVLHGELIDLYGGSHGIRDTALLDSALSQPQSGFDDDLFHKFPFEMAAAYLYHVAKNHPFVDGNKRIAFACARVFLLMHGYNMKATAKEKYSLVLSIAASEDISKQDIAKKFEQWCT